MDQPQNDSHPSIQQLVKWVESTKDRGMRSSDADGVDYDWDVPYVSQTALDNYFSQHQAVEKLLGALFSDNDPLKEALNARHIRGNYSKIFCLLITIGKGRFINSFVEYGINDQRLPLTLNQHDFPPSPSDPEFFTTFYQKQWQFCVPELHANTISRRFDPKECILPIRRTETLGNGGSATAYKVEVPRCYDCLTTVCSLFSDLGINSQESVG